ncbi:hypothetical protein NL676_013225 [Syzygium grande]|nr:hypothetical protein NL676_013225 [Syzygium grande]
MAAPHFCPHSVLAPSPSSGSQMSAAATVPRPSRGSSSTRTASYKTLRSSIDKASKLEVHESHLLRLLLLLLVLVLVLMPRPSAALLESPPSQEDGRGSPASRSPRDLSLFKFNLRRRGPAHGAVAPGALLLYLATCSSSFSPSARPVYPNLAGGEARPASVRLASLPHPRGPSLAASREAHFIWRAAVRTLPNG